MRILMAGGTGFVGYALVRRLLEDGHQVVIIQRPHNGPTSKSRIPQPHEVEVISLNLEEPIVSEMLRGDAIINLVGIIREFPSKGVTFHGVHFLVTKHLVDFARQRRIRRFIQMSAMGVRPDAQTGYEKSKFSAEQYVTGSGLEWTIFRPAVIVGAGDNFTPMLTGMIRNLPLVPVIGDGNYRVQLVNIDDVITGFRKALAEPRAIGRIFEFGGSEIITYNQLLDLVGAAMGISKVRRVHQPLWLIRPIARMLGRFAWFPVTSEQISMLLAGRSSSDNSYFELFGITPKTLPAGIAENLASKRIKPGTARRHKATHQQN